MVRLRQGVFSDATTYGDDPVEVVAGWHEEGAPLVHVVDLDGARSGTPDSELLRRLAAAPGEFQLGGGIRTVDDAAAAVDAGASRVVVGTTAVWEPTVLSAMVAAVGSRAVVAALDVAGQQARGSGWVDEGRPIGEVAQAAVDAGAQNLLVTAIGRDGMLSGPDLELLTMVRWLAPDAHVIASGGVASLRDLKEVAACGADAAVVGMAFYEGRFTYQEAVAAAGG